MFLDLTWTPPPMEKLYELATAHAPLPIEQVKALLENGHLGTHYDVMDKQWSNENFRTWGKLFDTSHIRDREVEVADLKGREIEEGDTVLFHTGILREFGYGSKPYTTNSANLSDVLVKYLIDRKIKIIGVDAAGAQKASKHIAVDQLCADNDVFIVENLDNLDALLKHAPKTFTVYTAPLNRPDLTGLPCRVIAEFDA